MPKIEFFESAKKEDWVMSSFMEKFHAVVKEVYNSDPNYLEKKKEDVEKELCRDEWIASQRSFVTEGGRITARYRSEGQENLGILSHFECINSSSTSKMLFDSSIQWLKDRGCKKIIGPMDGDTWHNYRVNAGPFENPTFFLEPYNPPYYFNLWKESGFEELEEYSSKHVSDFLLVKNKFSESYHSIIKDGYSFRECKLKNFEEELKLLYSLTLQSFSDNVFYSEISESEYLGLYAKMKRIIKSQDLHFLISPEGKEVGFLFALPDYQAAFKSFAKAGKILGPILFALESWKIKTLNLKTIGMLPEHRKKGMAKALLYKAYDVAERRGFTSANLCLMHKDNPSQNLDGGLGAVFRKYVLFEWSEKA